jgi:uroporphyrin-III C-methyltransferase
LTLPESVSENKRSKPIADLAEMNRPVGKVFLVGAGPGSAELLTLRAAEVLRECDVVLYDRLIASDVLALVNPAAERVYVGKHAGEQQRVQSEIFELILRHAGAGKKVVRLKGGDPLIFGRGAEEWGVAVEAGIEVELVPGLSSAISLPALAGIPLTYRGVSQGFAVVTGHCTQGHAEDWARYAAVDTLVILMGVKNRVHIARSLIEAGRNDSEPIAFVERGASPDERVTVATLGRVAAGQVTVKNPAVFVIGEVVRLRESLLPKTRLP